MSVQLATKTVTETVTKEVQKTVGVDYKSAASERELKLRKSQRTNGAFVVTVENGGAKSIVIKKAALLDFMKQAKAFIEA